MSCQGTLWVVQVGWWVLTVLCVLVVCWSQKIPVVQICNGDIDRPLRIEVFDFEKSGKHVFMGQVDTCVRCAHILICLSIYTCYLLRIHCVVLLSGVEVV